MRIKFTYNQINTFIDDCILHFFIFLFFSDIPGVRNPSTTEDDVGYVFKYDWLFFKGRVLCCSCITRSCWLKLRISPDGDRQSPVGSAFTTKPLVPFIHPPFISTALLHPLIFFLDSFMLFILGQPDCSS